MKTKTITLYEFDELSEEGKKKALSKLWDLNVDHEWWQFTYDDARRIGLKISEFDIDRGNYCKGKFIFPAAQVAEEIIKEHGKDCETYKTAESFLSEYKEALRIYDEKNTDSNDAPFLDDAEDFHDTIEFEDMANEFKKSLLEDYRIILRKEYEYLTSKEQIIESIKANEYTFTVNGKLENE